MKGLAGDDFKNETHLVMRLKSAALNCVSISSVLDEVVIVVFFCWQGMVELDLKDCLEVNLLSSLVHF